jgi:hypothetical protein
VRREGLLLGEEKKEEEEKRKRARLKYLCRGRAEVGGMNENKSMG